MSILGTIVSHHSAKCEKQFDVDSAREELARLRDERLQRMHAMPEENKMELLQRENDELKLYLSALIHLLMGKGIVSAHEMKQMAAVLDAQDGRVDNKFSGQIVP